MNERHDLATRQCRTRHLGRTLTDHLTCETLAALPQIKILQAFADAAGPLTAAEIVARTGLPRSSVFRALRGLVNNGFLYHGSQTRRYALGPRMLQLGMAARHQLVAEDIVTAPLTDLLRDTGETVTFNLLVLPWRVCTNALEPLSGLRPLPRVGAYHPLHLGASGKVILAHLPVEVAESLMTAAGLNKREAAASLNHLPMICQQGWVETTAELVPDVSAVAAPVFLVNRIFGSVSVSGPSNRLQHRFQQLRPLVMNTAAIISERLSAPAPSIASSRRQRSRA